MKLLGIILMLPILSFLAWAMVTEKWFREAVILEIVVFGMIIMAILGWWLFWSF